MASNPRQPRLRINRSTGLQLTPSWQKIDFNGTSQFNVNTFGKDPVTGNQLVMWDSTSKQLRFYDKYDQNYLCFINMTTTTNMISTRASIQLRFVIPNGTSPGVPLYFPFPSEGGYIDVGEATMIAANSVKMAVPIPLYLDQTIRTNGLWVEMKLSNALIALGVCMLENCTMLVQSTK